MEIKTFIANLEREITQTKQELYDSSALLRLKEVAAKYQGEDRVIGSLEYEAEIAIRPEETKHYSGWAGLDQILSGFRPNQLVVIAAPTKNGKTSFCMDLTARLKSANPLWFPFEEGADELIMKCLERGEKPPFFCVPRQNTQRDLGWLEEKIIEGIVKFNSQVVFIDHLHFIVPFAAERQDLRIGETMRNLKQIAKRWGITIFLIAHLKKTKLDTNPDLEDLRDSSFIAQEADTVILLWRQTKKSNNEVEITNNVNVSVQANRRTGKTGNVKMIFNEGHFLEQAWTDFEKEANEERKSWAGF